MTIPKTQADLQKLIDDKVEESLTLEFKHGGALTRDDKKKDEITKDVTSFANSAGGLLIYGLAEGPTDDTKHLAVTFAPVDRTFYSKEWLEQIIHRAQPRLTVEIFPIPLNTGPTDVAYAIVVPQGDTAHQAMDKKYYKRFNFMSVPMEDYELRDVMNRRRHPLIRCSLFVNVSKVPDNGLVLVRVENISRVIAKIVMVEVDFPVEVRGHVHIDDPVHLELTDQGDFFRFRMISRTPVFPGSDLKFEKRIKTGCRLTRRDNRPVNSIKFIRVSVFADEMPALTGIIDLETALKDWAVLSPS